jgi:hypothetical protein
MWHNECEIMNSEEILNDNLSNPGLGDRHQDDYLQILRSSGPQVLRSSGHQVIRSTWEFSARFEMSTVFCNFYKLLHFNQRLISHRIDFDHVFFDSLHKDQNLIRIWSIMKTITLEISSSKWLHSRYIVLFWNVIKIRGSSRKILIISSRHETRWSCLPPETLTTIIQ